MIVGGKELAHYGRVDSVAEVDATAERKLNEHAAATASSRALLAALQAQERTQRGGEPPQLRQEPQQVLEPRKASKRAKRKHKKAARATGAGAVAAAGAGAGAGAPRMGKKRRAHP